MQLSKIFLHTSLALLFISCNCFANRYFVNLPFIADQEGANSKTCYYKTIPDGLLYITSDSKFIFSLRTESGDGKFEFKETFVNAYPVLIKPGEISFTELSFIKGALPEKWVQKIPAYNILNLGEIYDNIEMCLVARGSSVEKLFSVNPGGDHHKIMLKVENAEWIRISDRGELIIEKSCGKISFSAPFAYQEICGIRKMVDVKYEVVNRNTYGFTLGEYDENYAVTIDPLLGSTFLGGSNDDGSTYLNTNMKVGPDNCVYVAGSTDSPDFPYTPAAYDTMYHDDLDVYVAKFDASLTTLLSATFIGGMDDEEAGDLTFDNMGNIYVCGNTKSYDFPVTDDAYCDTYNGTSSTAPYEAGGDVFVLKLNNNLSELLASTYFGGESHEYCRGIIINDEGNICFTGATASVGFPVSPGAYMGEHQPGGYYAEDAYVSILDPDLENLIASSYLGGNDFDYAECIDIDSEGNIYIAGWAGSNNFPTISGCFDTTYNGHYYDAFLSKFNNDLTTLSASTFLGGSGWDFNYGMIIDDDDNIYVTGHTSSAYNFPRTSTAYDTSFNGAGIAGEDDDSYISKFTPGLNSLIASTFIGGDLWEIGLNLQIDNNGDIFVVGFSNSENYPTTIGAYNESSNGLNDVVVSKLSPDLTSLVASTCFGGFYDDYGHTICLDNEDNIYFAGRTASLYIFPVSNNAYQSQYGGGIFDAFISKLDNDLSADETTVKHQLGDNSYSHDFKLFPPHPNPFNPMTTITYSTAIYGFVSLKIFDISGRLVTSLVENFHDAGTYELIFDCGDLPSGTYFAVLEQNGMTVTQKLMLIK